MKSLVGCLILLLVGFAQSVCSQDLFLPFLRAEYEASQFTGTDLNDYFRSYNGYYENRGTLAQPFDTLALGEMSHAGFGAGIRYVQGSKSGFTAGFFMTYGEKSVQRNSSYQNDIRTQLDYEVRDLNATFDLGLHIHQKPFLQVHMGGRFRKNVVAQGYVYQDGSYSLGDEYDLLGVYSVRTTTLDLGASLGFKLGRFFIPISFSLPTNAFSDDGLLDLSDFDKRQIRWAVIPRDFPTWVNDPANLDLDTGFVRGISFRSSRLTIGVEYWLTRTGK